MRRSFLAVASLLITGSLLAAQTPPAEFEVISIKRSPADATGNSLQTLPDGTFIMHNGTIRSILLSASPTPVREVEGYPAWVASERYEITAKPPAGATREQRAPMMRRMFEDRMKLKGHVDQRERDIFALVVARSDGRLGPQLKPSTLDCLAQTAPRAAGLTLKWAPPRGATGEPHADDPPDFVTAIQEQLGLKLQSEKATLSVFVVDAIERPSEN